MDVLGKRGKQQFQTKEYLYFYKTVSHHFEHG